MPIDPSLPTPNDIASILREQSVSSADAVALEYLNGQLTYAELWALVQETVSVIHHTLPPTSGRRQRIAIVHDNGPGMAVLLLGICSAATALPFNPSYSISELRSRFISTQLDGLVLPESGFDEVEALANELTIPILRIAWDKPSRQVSPISLEDIELSSPDDLAIVLLTSGSTGKSKAVPLTHRNVCVSAFEVCKSLQLGEQDKCLCMWEQYHIGGLVDLLLAPLMSGGTVIVTSGFSVENFFDLLVKARPTWFQGVPTTLGELKSRANKYDVIPANTSLRLLRSVAAPLPAALQNEIEQLFNVPVLQTFGMTEAGPLITSTLLPPYQQKLGSVGSPCGTKIAIYSLSGSLLLAGEEGEVAIQGSNVFSGYENDDKTTPSQFRNGWFFTGDLGYLDKDGDLFLTGRIKQLINRGGEKINPQEVDNQLITHPDIASAACFSTPHPTLGEDIMAAIVFQKGRSCETADIREYLREKLTSFKIPSRIVIVDEIPHNSLGKVDRAETAKLVEQQTVKNNSTSLPSTPVEKDLAEIWAAELDLDNIGLEDDFFERGGDSLSSVRIVLAVEKYFNLKMPEKDIFALTSVGRMAKYIEKVLDSRIDPLDMSGPRKPLTKETAWKLTISPEISFIDDEQNYYKILYKLKSADSKLELKELGDLFSVYQTPNEIREALQSISTLPPLEGWRRQPVKTFKKQLSLRIWIMKIKLDLIRYNSKRDWHRIPIHDHTLLYQSQKGKASKKLIIGLSGLTMRLMMPTHIILSAIKESDFDLMLIRDPDRNHYREGVSGLGSNLNELALKIKDLAVQAGYNQYVVLGTSAGGLPAIRIGQIIQAEHVLAVGPDNPERHPEIANQLSSAKKTIATTFKICISANNKRDNEAAHKLKMLMPHVNVIPYRGIKTHNLLYKLHKKQKLTQFLAEHLLDITK